MSIIYIQSNLQAYLSSERHHLIFFFFSSTTLCEFWLTQLFLSIVSPPASFVSNCSLPSSSSHSSHRLPILLSAFPSVLLRTVRFIYGLDQFFFAHSFYMPQPAQSYHHFIECLKITHKRREKRGSIWCTVPSVSQRSLHLWHVCLIDTKHENVYWKLWLSDVLCFFGHETGLAESRPE